MDQMWGSEGSNKIWHEQLTEVGTSEFSEKRSGFHFRPKGISTRHLVLKLKGNIWNQRDKSVMTTAWRYVKL